MSRLFVCVFALLVTSSVANADLVEFTDDFPYAGPSNFATPANWAVAQPNLSNVFLGSGDSDDNSLLDGDGDGYATLNGRVTFNGGNYSPAVSRDFGVVMASDVGSTIELDLAYLEDAGVGAEVTAGIASNGSFVAQSTASTLGANPDSGLLNVSYVVDAADVGSTFSVRFEFFSTSDDIFMGIDAAHLSITAVPEPSALVLLVGLAGMACPIRRRIA